MGDEKPPNPKSEPVQETTKAEEQDSKSEAVVSASLPVGNPDDAGAEEPEPDDAYDETDRKQDKTLQSIAEQTEWEARQTDWMAKQTYWLKLQAVFSIVFGVATLGVLFLHGWIMWDQSVSNRDAVIAAKEQLGVMQKQFEAADRPWLSVEAAPKGPLLFRQGGVGVTAKFTVKNVGRSVANGAVVIADVFIGKSGEDVYGKAIERQRQICDETTTTITRHTVFPGDTFTDGQLLIAEKTALENGPTDGSNELPFFLIIGCVNYRFGDQPTRHRTNFIYDVGRTDRRPIQIGQDVPVGNLTLYKSSSGGDDAH